MEIASAPAEVVVPPAQQALVSAPVGGVIARLFVAEGDAVTAGQTLAELESAELLERQHMYLDKLAAEELASAQEERDRGLFAEGIIAERRMQETAAAARAARAELDQARMQLEFAGFSAGDLDRLAAQRELRPELTIRAPFAGVVSVVHTEVGARLDTLDPVLGIADLSDLWIELRLRQESASQVAPGMTVAADVGARAVGGTITTVGRVVDPDTQTVLVRAELDATAIPLRAGQFLVTRVLAKPPGGVAYGIPTAAVTRHGNEQWVFVREGETFAAEAITVLAQGDALVYVAEPIEADVAIEGISALKALWLAGDEGN
jgi:RND family efflux transporter MFP subunit